ncbi:MAG TPA: cobaltochelatase subunit CobN, partial [Alphaproteobacteria bacterium]|nr:cobaltochelatase subunit CobN [Alphaproteobacteria bacterium]
MHLLSAQAASIQQEGEAIDLGQSPAPLVFASAADSELALMAGAADRAGAGDLRCASILRLSHNLSVDLWIDSTVRHARLVVVRLLGGPAYWPYGVDELTALAASGAIRLALLPGDANPDPILCGRSTIPAEAWSSLHALFTAGGPDNADALLAAFRVLAEPGPAEPRLPRPSPFPRFGLWHPATGIRTPDAPDVLAGAPLPSVPGAAATTGRASVPLLFYRAALEGGGTATLAALVAEIERQGLHPVPILVSSLKERACARFVRDVLAAHPPAAILNLTGFALGLDGLEAEANPFAGTDAPVLQLVQGGRPRSAWSADPQGLTAKDLAMQVVLPELDGRIGALLVGHKEEAVWHARTECPLASYAPDPDGIRRAVTLARNWARLRATPRGERRIAIVLANYPIRDGRLANGVGYDAPQSTVEILNALAASGYGLDDGRPADGNALIARLQQGPTNAHPERGEGIAFPLARYRALFALLPERLQGEVTARWGDPAGDPFCRGDAFHLPALRLGNVAVLLQPARGYHLDETASYHDPDLVPPHGYLAAYLWLRHEFAAHAVIHNGKHGNLEWLPGKATALDGASYPLALWAELPHLYPFIVNDPGEGTQAKRRAGAVIIDHLVPPLTRAETYGPLKELEALLDEYYAASGLDRRRLADLRRRILDFARDARLDRDVLLPPDENESLKRLDTFLCELKEAQIRDGLHVFGRAPAG